jgi:hypothetical protein
LGFTGSLGVQTGGRRGGTGGDRFRAVGIIRGAVGVDRADAVGILRAAGQAAVGVAGRVGCGGCDQGPGAVVC